MTHKGKVAWITGASSGIGAALARQWAARGGNVILSGRDIGRLHDVGDSLATESLLLPFDVRDEETLADATEAALGW
jgi:NADP-dependent 3-hydroxy acid dehydrogenase YdfG